MKLRCIATLAFACLSGCQLVSPGSTPHVDDALEQVIFYYPEPTDAVTIARDVARWSGKTYIVGSAVDVKMTLGGKDPMTQYRVEALFLQEARRQGLGVYESDSIVELFPATQNHELQDRLHLSTPRVTFDNQDRVSMRYETPTDLETIVKDVAEWSHRKFIVNVGRQERLSILSYDPEEKEHAYRIFQRALRYAHYVEREKGPVVQIVDSRAPTARSPQPINMSSFFSVSKRGSAKIHYPDSVDIKDIVADVAKWSGKNVLLSGQTRGDVSIHSPEQLSKKDAYLVFLAALDQLGLEAVEQNGQTIIRRR